MIKIEGDSRIKTGETKTSKYCVYPNFTLQIVALITVKYMCTFLFKNMIISNL